MRVLRSGLGPRDTQEDDQVLKAEVSCGHVEIFLCDIERASIAVG